MKISIAHTTLVSLSPYSQSRNHETSKLKGELADAYDKRTWLDHCTTDEEKRIILPTGGILQALTAAAKYSKKQIPGQGKATWTAKFNSGLSIVENVITDMTVKSAVPEDIYCNSDGIRGSGKRVMRRFPVWPEWRASFPILIMDPIITEEIFREIVDIAGVFIGFGRWRPEKGGMNGRFKLADLKWEDNREFEDLLKKRQAA